MNKVELMGRITKDIQAHVSDNESGNKYARYTLAVRRKSKGNTDKDTDFIPCVCFGKSAEWAEKYLRKGMMVAVCGRISENTYTDQNGNRVYGMNVIVEEHFFAESRKANGGEDSTEDDSNGFVQITEDMEKDLPFE